MPLAVIRADATQLSGGGHVMRCLSLANVLAENGWEVLFSGLAQTPEFVPALAQSVFEWRTLKNAHNADELAAHVFRGCDLLVVDHYDLDQTFEQSCRSFARRILVIDDLADRPHDCDFLLDQTFRRSAEDYKPLVPQHCQYLIGPDFALLRRQFSQARYEALKRRGADIGLARVLISFGATDSHNLTERTLLALDQTGFQGHTEVILGTQAPHSKKVRAMAARSPFGITVHSEVTDMAALMSQADFAIGAGGTTSWERCCLGLPSLIVIVADNQNLITRELEKVGAAASVGWHQSVTVSDIAGAVTALLSRPERLKTMSDKAATICDGLGAQRTYQALST